MQHDGKICQFNVSHYDISDILLNASNMCVFVITKVLCIVGVVMYLLVRMLRSITTFTSSASIVMFQECLDDLDDLFFLLSNLDDLFKK